MATPVPGAYPSYLKTMDHHGVLIVSAALFSLHLAYSKLSNENRPAMSSCVCLPIACHQPTLLWIVRKSWMEANGAMSQAIQGLDMRLEGPPS